MNYNHYSNLEGRHALLGASKSSWLRKSQDELISMMATSYIKTIGTALHDIARKHIKHRMKMTRSGKKEVYLSLIEDYHIPPFAIDEGIDFDEVYDNVMLYVNDAISFRLVPEVILFYSMNCFGTADGISDLDSVMKTKQLRIHDLKTGKSPVHIEQLYIYAALFCLEYNFKPGELDIEVRLYQNGEAICDFPTAEDIGPIMDLIISNDKFINSITEAK